MAEFKYDPYGSSSNSFYSPFPKQSQELTPLQVLEAAYLRRGKKRSMLGRLFSSIGHGLETGLQVIAAPSHAIAGGVLEATRGEANDFNVGRFLHGAKQGITLKEKHGFGEVLSEHSGFFRKHKILSGVAGLGLDVVTDPTLLLGVGVPGRLTAEAAAKLAARESALGLEKGAISTAEKIALNGPKDLKEARASFDALNKAGEGFEARKALAAKNLELFQLKKEFPEIGKEQLTPHLDQLAGLQAMADAERATNLSRKVALTYKVPFSRASNRVLDTGRLVLHTPLKAPTMKSIALQESVIGRLPLTAKITEQLGRAFKPEWDNPKFHALENVAKRTTEHLDKDYMDRLGADLGEFMAGAGQLSESAMLDALHVGETTKGIVDPATRLLSRPKVEQLVAGGALTERQAQFLEKWHGFTEYLRLQDLKYGRSYDKKGSAHLREGAVYVPHLYTKDGKPITAQFGSSILVKPGYEYARLAKSLQSVKMIKELNDTGVYRDVLETNPAKLMIIRARRGAQAHSDAMLRDIIAKSYGVPKWVADDAKLKALADEQEALLKKVDRLTLAKDPEKAWKRIEKKIHKGHEARMVEATAAHMEGRKAIQRKVRRLQDQIRKTKAGDAVPTATKLTAMSQKDWQSHVDAVGLKWYGRVGTRIRSRYQVATKVEQKMRRLSPKTGGKAHGSNYKGLLAELIAETEPKILRGGKNIHDAERRAVREARENWKALKALQDPTLRKGETWESRLRSAVTQAKKNSHAEWNAFVAQQGVRRTDPLLKAQLATQKKALVAHGERIGKVVDKVEKRTAREVEVARKAFDKRVAVEQRKMAKANKRLDTIERKAEHHQASLLNPKIPAGYVENTRLRHPVNDSALMIPPEMNDALSRVKDALENDQFLADFARTWARLTSRWKVAATVINPGYRVRNTISDLWNMYIRGVPLWAIGRYGEKAARLVHNMDQKDAQMFIEAYDHGIFSGLFQGDVEKILRFVSKNQGSAGQMAKRGKLGAAYTKFMTDFNREAENWGRLTHYLYRREYLGESAAEAAKQVRIAHFDYEDLTKTERKLKQNLVPFWTWTRKNIPYQITSYLSNPGKYALFPKMANEAEFAAGDNEGQVVPDWISNQFAFRVPFGGKGNFFIPQFGPTDLSKLSNPGQALGMLHPGIKAGAELAFNKSALTGAPIYGDELTHPRVPVAGGLVGELLKMIPGSNVGTTARKGKGGSVLRGTGANPLVAYFAQQTPLTNVLVNQRSNIRQAQRGGGDKALMSYVLGLSTYAPNQEQQLGIKQQEEQQSFQQYLRGLRDEGRLPEPQRNASSFDEQRKKLLKQLYGEK